MPTSPEHALPPILFLPPEEAPPPPFGGYGPEEDTREDPGAPSCPDGDACPGAALHPPSPPFRRADRMLEVLAEGDAAKTAKIVEQAKADQREALNKMATDSVELLEIALGVDRSRIAVGIFAEPRAGKEGVRIDVTVDGQPHPEAERLIASFFRKAEQLAAVVLAGHDADVREGVERLLLGKSPNTGEDPEGLGRTGWPPPQEGRFIARMREQLPSEPCEEANFILAIRQDGTVHVLKDRYGRPGITTFPEAVQRLGAAQTIALTRAAAPIGSYTKSGKSQESAEEHARTIAWLDDPAKRDGYQAGTWVALRAGEVVDYDTSKGQLTLRLQARDDVHGVVVVRITRDGWSCS